MLRRKMMQQLRAWKESGERRCLIVQGARQVGKTYLVRAFAKEYCPEFLEFNFILNPADARIFDGNLNVDQILMNLSLYRGYTYDASRGKPLLFLDEIQAAPAARTALKAFAEDGRFDVIASGSLLGIRYGEVPSFPAGYVTYLELFPLDFEEFLWALGIPESVFTLLRDCFRKKHPVPEAVNEKMHEWFRTYMVTGGMPAVLADFVENRNFSRVLSMQRDILVDYRNDIAKYAAGSEKVKAAACFDSIPAQLGKANAKFQYSTVEKGGRSAKYAGSVQWLADANIALPCRCLSSIRMPLAAYDDPQKFKLYLSDTGLLVSMLDAGTNALILEGKLDAYRGAVYENAIAQSFASKGRQLHYYERNNTLEIDFVLSRPEDPLHPYLLEVKAGNNRAKSLVTLVREGKHDFCVPIKLIGGNVGETSPDGILALPSYMVLFL